MAPVFVMGLGLTVGLEHAFEADHVAAVSTQISKSKTTKKSTKQILGEGITKSSLLGVFWGAGHTTTLVLMGLLVYALAITVQDQVFSGLEFVVGLMLVFLGVTTILNRKITKFKHRHPHQHEDGTVHLDAHEHTDVDHKHGHKSYLIGLVHGLAGSGGLVVLTAATLDNVGLVLEFILIFGIGSMIGMAIIGSIMGIPIALANRMKIVQKLFRYVAGSFSFLIGLNIIYEISITGNLFEFF